MTDQYALFKAFALEVFITGRRRYGAKGIVERMRWHAEVESGGTFKLNNNDTSRFARRLAEEDPRFEGFFRFRSRRAHS